MFVTTGLDVLGSGGAGYEAQGGTSGHERCSRRERKSHRATQSTGKVPIPSRTHIVCHCTSTLPDCA